VSTLGIAGQSNSSNSSCNALSCPLPGYRNAAVLFTKQFVKMAQSKGKGVSEGMKKVYDTLNAMMKNLESKQYNTVAFQMNFQNPVENRFNVTGCNQKSGTCSADKTCVMESQIMFHVCPAKVETDGSTCSNCTHGHAMLSHKVWLHTATVDCIKWFTKADAALRAASTNLRTNWLLPRLHMCTAHIEAVMTNGIGAAHTQGSGV